MILEQNYNRDEFLTFLKSFIPKFTKDVRRVGTSGLQVTKEIFYLGESAELSLSIFELTHSSTADARVALAMDGFKVMKSSATYRALVIYRADKGEDWRLSLMTATPGVNQKGKVGQTLSNPRRFSFFLGPHAKIKTPHQFLIKEGTVKDFSDLQKRFSLEVVNKEFYREISENFTKLVGGTIGSGKNKKTYKAILKLPSVPDQSQVSLEFAVRLIGRIIFCWFLREKKSPTGSALMPKGLLSHDAIGEHRDYYHQILESIFFEVLNKELKSRGEHYSEAPFSLIPYLNGGLFSPHEDDYYKRRKGEQSLYHNTLVIPDQWFTDFFKTLETYNFTIDENTSFDEELSIDPEMLGRIFENLLAEINPETGESARKSTGSFYTPRVIVDYMVDESLLLYLKQQTNIKEEKLRAIISYDLNDDSEYPLDESEKQKIIDALEKLKLLDPACGSGAFPIGALQKIVFILQQIDKDGRLWFKKQIKSSSPEIRRVIEREFAHENFDYIRKLGIIRENIYGIDIQPIATEISRLRCFLTLVVDERIDDSLENRGIEPLPNLDFKFVTANSLIGLPATNIGSQRELFEDDEGIKDLKEIRDMFFGASGSERDHLRLQFVQRQKKIFQDLISEKKLGHAELTTRLTTWDPFNNKSSSWFDPEWMFGVTDGFDVVIANPPYISIEKFARTSLQVEWKQSFKNTFAARGDIYCLFYEQGLALLRENGVLTFISSNKFQRAGYGKGLRNILAAQRIYTLIDFCELPVFAAATDPMIVIAAKATPVASHEFPVLVVKDEAEFNSLHKSLEYRASHYKSNQLKAEGWSLEGGHRLALVEKMRAKGVPLGKYVRNSIMAGIKTGYNKAFWLDIGLVEKFRSEDHVLANKFLKPLLLGDEARRWLLKPVTKFLIYTPRGTSEAELGYLKNYLTQWRERLEQRALDQQWFELQQAQFRYSTTYQMPKIVYPDIALEPRFSLDNNGRYPDMTAFSIPSGDHSLVAILNSSALWFFLCRIAAVLGDADNRGRVRCKTQYVSQLPIPIFSDVDKARLSKLAEQAAKLAETNNRIAIKKVEQEIDEIVYRLFDLTPEEIINIENSLVKIRDESLDHENGEKMQEVPEVRIIKGREKG